MEEASIPRRFKINPIELILFSAVGLILARSAYNLFYSETGSQFSALVPMASNPTSAGRQLSSTSQSFLNINVGCDANPDASTGAARVRLVGPLCGHSSVTDKLTKTSVINNSNRFAATVFADESLNKFSTDYIPLNIGKNSIRIEFFYEGGKVASEDLTIVKN